MTSVHQSTDVRTDEWDAVSDNKIAPSFYWSPALYEAELDRIFRTSWVYVGHASEVPTPNSYCRKRVAGQELVLTRDQADVVRVLFNRCSHRGNLVCMAPRGEANTLKCAYHGWAFTMDGSLRAVPRPDAYADRLTQMRSKLGLGAPAATESYGGFVFVRLEEDESAPSFDEFIGPVRSSIDRLTRLSPDGEVTLTGGWIGHRLHCNWKMVVESNVDNYHVNFVHKSLSDAIPGSFDSAEDLTVRHLGMGHTEVDFRPQYRRDGREMVWSGAVRRERLGDYVPRLEQRHGEQEAHEVLVDGPPHVMVFPNLFLSQMNIMVIDPVSAEESAAYTTPVFLAGARELNRRTALQCSGAMGPAGLIIADDAEIGDRNQVALHTVEPSFLDISRGVERETAEGAVQESKWGGDETTQRGIWRSYRDLMNRR
ncbi:aromatic ring-hydroxylating oxygenase subunit alpha [Actinomycetospora sp. C-140]